jgi:hypothetical protein
MARTNWRPIRAHADLGSLVDREVNARGDWVAMAHAGAPERFRAPQPHPR